MSDVLRSRARVTILASFLALAMGCKGNPPSPSPEPERLSVMSVSPGTGPTTRPIRLSISGAGFVSGAVVTIGGVSTNATEVVTSRFITAWTPTPPNAAGAADVIVTNPDGQSSRLTSGFLYFVPRYAISAGADRVGTGGSVTVTWTVDAAGPWDWVGLFRLGDPNTTLDHGWEYTGGGTSGTLTFTAPTLPGLYDFRYLLDDGYDDAARSHPVTVQ